VKTADPVFVGQDMSQCAWIVCSLENEKSILN